MYSSDQYISVTGLHTVYDRPFNVGMNIYCSQSSGHLASGICMQKLDSYRHIAQQLKKQFTFKYPKQVLK